MKVFCVCGLTKSGKTTTTTALISELTSRGYSVGSVKDIHFESFTMETEGTNTYKHKSAGANPVTALSNKETDIMFSGRIDIKEILKFYKTDYVVIEGGRDLKGLPKIFTAKLSSELSLIDNSCFCISGVISNDITEYDSFAVYNPFKDITKLTDLVEEKVFDVLPLVDNDCCRLCGGCAELCFQILNGSKSRKDCLLSKKVILKIGNENIEMVDFVQNILKDTTLAVVKGLKGYRFGEKITIEINET